MFCIFYTMKVIALENPEKWVESRGLIPFKYIDSAANVAAKRNFKVK